MLITELTPKERLDLLTRAQLGRLACAKDGKLYIMPLFFAYHDNYFLFGILIRSERLSGCVPTRSSASK